MARKRPSVQKRQREYQKRQREIEKAEKAAQKRERRQNREEPGDAPLADAEEVPRGVTEETAGPGD
ncbi:MAG: hypothetical protein KKB50_14405 [Planctomycetes bacterium]|nr:hypothetical protein [Planctomycetota bacterium]